MHVLATNSRTRMSAFIDLDRRFHELTDQELDDFQSLELWGDYLPNSTIGWPELLKHHRAVLLAEAGAGKTAEMRQQVKHLVEKGDSAFGGCIRTARNDCRLGTSSAFWRRGGGHLSGSIRIASGSRYSDSISLILCRRLVDLWGASCFMAERGTW